MAEKKSQQKRGLFVQIIIQIAIERIYVDLISLSIYHCRSKKIGN